MLTFWTIAKRAFFAMNFLYTGGNVYKKKEKHTHCKVCGVELFMRPWQKKIVGTFSGECLDCAQKKYHLAAALPARINKATKLLEANGYTVTKKE